VCSIVNACEWIAAVLQDTFFADGRAFTYVEHHPGMITGSPEPTFAIVHLNRPRRYLRRSTGPRGLRQAKEGSLGRAFGKPVLVVGGLSRESWTNVKMW
jgi:hypothetical protein